MRQRPGTVQIIAARLDLDVEEVFPGAPRTGRLSSLVRLMSRSANTLRALNNAPGVLGSEKTMVVLFVLRGGPRR